MNTADERHFRAGKRDCVYRVKNAAGISFNVLAKMGKNEFVSMESLHKICLTLKCDVGDIMEFVDEGVSKQS